MYQNATLVYGAETRTSSENYNHQITKLYLFDTISFQVLFAPFYLVLFVHINCVY